MTTEKMREALLADLTAVESLLGGSNGPTIRIRAALAALSRQPAPAESLVERLKSRGAKSMDPAKKESYLKAVQEKVIPTLEQERHAKQFDMLPVPAAEHGQLDPRMAEATARQMLRFVEAFNSEKFDSVSDSVDRRNLATALDNLLETAAMLLNLADRVPAQPAPVQERMGEAREMPIEEEPEPRARPKGFHNPWRAPLENCMTGDNYLKANEYEALIGELDELYQYKCGQHEALNVAYAQGRDDQREEDEEAAAAALASTAPVQPTEPDGSAEIHRLMDLLRWSYSKLVYRSFADQDDALRMDEIKMLLVHGI